MMTYLVRLAPARQLLLPCAIFRHSEYMRFSPIFKLSRLGALIALKRSHVNGCFREHGKDALPALTQSAVASAQPASNPSCFRSLVARALADGSCAMALQRGAT